MNIKPRAWMVIVCGGPAQATTDEPTAIRWRRAGGVVVALYDQAAIDSAVAAERERLTEAVMSELDGNGQAQAIVARAALPGLELMP